MQGEQLYDSYNPTVPNTVGLHKLLLSVADRMEGNVDGLNKELLVQSAYRIMRLEEVAWQASEMIVTIPRKPKVGRQTKSFVAREDVKSLAARLKAAGYNVKEYV